MLAIHLSTVRLFLHVAAATVWVGGQLTLAALTPTLRGLDRSTLRAVARRFSSVAWIAFAVLVATGVWNLAAGDAAGAGPAYRRTLALKLAAVALSGLTALLHQRSRARAALAAWGAASGLTALLALFLGVLLHG